MTAAGAARVPMGEAAYLRGLGDDQAARVMGSAERAQRVLSGVPAETVINGGKDPLYHLVRVGQPQAQQHALAPKVQQPSETFGPYDPGAPRSVPDTSTPARRVVTKIEDQIRGDALETAAIVLPGTGSPSRTAL